MISNIFYHAISGYKKLQQILEKYDYYQYLTLCGIDILSCLLRIFLKKFRVTISEQDSTPETRFSEHGSQITFVHQIESITKSSPEKVKNMKKGVGIYSLN